MPVRPLTADITVGRPCTQLLDDDVIEYFRVKAEARGSGYQTMINAALREAVAAEQGTAREDRPVTVAVLRKVLREELHQ
jgi:hypothetical protein